MASLDIYCAWLGCFQGPVYFAGEAGAGKSGYRDIVAAGMWPEYIGAEKLQNSGTIRPLLNLRAQPLRLLLCVVLVVSSFIASHWMSLL